MEADGRIRMRTDGMHMKAYGGIRSPGILFPGPTLFLGPFVFLAPTLFLMVGLRPLLRLRPRLRILLRAEEGINSRGITIDI